MRLSDLLGAKVCAEDGRRLGVVHDVVAVQAGPVTAGFDAAIELRALMVGPQGIRARLGMSPAHVSGPWLARLLAMPGRRTDTIPWTAVTAVEPGRIVVGPISR
jgi:sporulation protein YlmC with PRC-barrel domain